MKESDAFEASQRLFKARVETLGNVAKKKIRRMLNERGIDTSYFEERDRVLNEVLSIPNTNYLKRIAKR